MDIVFVMNEMKMECPVPQKHLKDECTFVLLSFWFFRLSHFCCHIKRREMHCDHSSLLFCLLCLFFLAWFLPMLQNHFQIIRYCRIWKWEKQLIAYKRKRITRNAVRMIEKISIIDIHHSLLDSDSGIEWLQFISELLSSSSSSILLDCFMRIESKWEV